MDGHARRMWQLFEPVHAVTYFAPEAREASDAAGLRGFWMAYAAQRIAPLGAVGPEVAEAAFFVFHPDRLTRALPDAWSFSSPEAALRARSDGAVAALRRLDVLDDSAVREAADLAGRAASAVDVAGRVLAAANRALPVAVRGERSDGAGIDEQWAALWQATTTLREHRGDGHVAALVGRGLDPVAAQLLKTATGDAPADWMRDSRAWPVDVWDDGARRLRERGLLDADGALTASGARLQQEVEDATDTGAEGPWRHLGDAGTERLAGLLEPLSAAVLDSGTVPVPNPMGLVRAR